ncbi:MAG: NAD(P)/FAD-dependent oxidoreductase [Actinomycetota bacterium]
MGGGFAGLNVVRALAKAPVVITLIDHHNHHLFQPLLYQVATASLNPSDVAAPIRRILRKQRNVSVLLAQADSIDLAGRRVVLVDDEVSYDFLVVATGVTHSYFGNDGWAKHAPGLKTLADALAIREKMLFAYEAAERESDPIARQEWLNFVIVGGGPTGVEMAGSMIEIARRALDSDFRNYDPRTARVFLVEAGARVLPAFHPSLSAKAESQLAKLGVELRLDSAVTGINERGVAIGDERIASRNVIWAAGIKASSLGASLVANGGQLDGSGRVKVSPDLSVPGSPEVFVAGDLAAVMNGSRPVPGVAPAAMQMGKAVAANIMRSLKGEPTIAFRYRDKGSLATIGRAAAVADLKRVKLSGLLAWLAWLSIHIFFLIGFRNRTVVMLEWARAYLGNEWQARLITSESSRLRS